MKQFLALLMVFCLATGFVFSSVTAEDNEWIVVEEEETVPDARYQARVLMRKMTLEDKICQLLVVTPEALTGEKYTSGFQNAAALMSKTPVGGIILYGQNIVSADQICQMIADAQAGAEAAKKYPPFFAVDEEGGNVSRIAGKLGYPYGPAPSEIKSAEEAKQTGVMIGAYLKDLGIMVDFAPDADVLLSDGAKLGSRSFGSDAERVSAFASAMASGLRESGVIPCYKHYPGLGSALSDSHRGQAIIKRTLSQLREEELLPFARGIGENIEMIMISHATVKEIDSEYPAALSRAVITGLLREEMGYDGVVITDALRMRAVTEEYGSGKAAVLSILAGADLLLLPNDMESALRGIRNALEEGTVTEERIDESVERILALKIAAGIIR